MKNKCKIVSHGSALETWNDDCIKYIGIDH